MHTDIAAGPLPVRLTRSDLAACVDALLGNVFAHTPDSTPFAITLARIAMVAGTAGVIAALAPPPPSPPWATASKPTRAPPIAPRPR